ncbi:Zn(2)-C6 fungal-type domain-containing protein [Mycena kentingensis (nom. inval.)]|nr:Zn(2)-C6 fungal-type domain-containing protein [Mycena kentingensis (nom. inval.)]
MSSEEDTPSPGPTKVRRRRLQRSCDACKKRKIRCDSATMPDGRCTHCKSFNAECLHTEPVRKRGPKNKQVEDLKLQLSALEEKLRVVKPDSTNAPSAPVALQYPSPPNDSSPLPGPSLAEESVSHDELAERFRQFNLNSLKHRFFGSSSGFMLVKNTINVKEEYLGRPIVTQFRRPEFWNQRPWEISANDQRPQYVFPDQQLMNDLIKLYFDNVQPCFPLLHRPTFERSVAKHLHISDHRFGGLVLSVLAVASRFSDDPRVFVPEAKSTLSSGWNFFKQVQIVRKSLFDEPSLYEVQNYCLVSLYTLGTSSPQSSWLYVGLGIRFIQERGEHRKKRDGAKPNAETELWKRAFWCLLTLDRTVSSFLGRPSAIHAEDYDVELPLEVDDDYWDHPDPNLAFKQPAGQPSLMTYFICNIRLCEILGSTLRRLYASNKSRILMGLTGRDWEQRAVAELDSAMNEFLGSVPEHLRWDANRTGVFFDQSATLHTMYYWLQITIHRPYILAPTTLAFPSLAICTSAARSAIHVVDVWLTKMQRVALPAVQTSVFISGVILLLNLFGVKRAGLPIDVGKELAHVSTSMRILKFMETRWQTAGRLWELLQELQAWDGPPPPQRSNNAQAPPRDDMVSADMCPIMRQQLEQALAAEKSVFSNAEGIPTPETTPKPAEAVASDNTNGSFDQPMDVWSDPLLSMSGANQAALNTSGSTNVPRPELTIEQLLATTATAQAFPNLGSENEQWTDTALASMMVDDDLMAMWGAAPTGLGNWADWDDYLENRTNQPAQRTEGIMTWGNNFDPRLSSSKVPQ